MRKQNTNMLPVELGKVPPQAVDLEEAVLGALMQFPNALYEIADDFSPDAFYKQEHQEIAQSIANLFDTNKKIDLLIVTDELRKRGVLDIVGGPIYVSMLLSKATSLSHVKDHYSIVFQKYIQREIIRESYERLSCAFDESVEMDELIEKLNIGTDNINEKIAGKKQASHISFVLEKSMAELKARELAAKDNKLVGIKTPVIDLDKKLQGWKPNVIVLAAASGEGKTAAALSVAKTAAESGIPVCIYSLEMQDVTLGDRLILAEADVDEYAFRSGYITRQDRIEIDKAKAKLSRLPIYVDDNPIVNFTYIKVHSRIMKKKGQCGIIIIDYIQLAETEKDQTREREIAKFMRNLVILKKELNVPIIALSQLNDNYENRRSKRPSLSQLRESKSIVNDADIVIFIYRQEYHGILEDENGNSTKGVGIFIVAKHRNGPTGDVKFIYNPSITKIKDWVDPNRFTPQQPASNRDRQLPQEKDDVNDIPDQQEFLPF